MRSISHKLRKLTAQWLDLPQDVIFDLPRVTMIGNMQVYVENHRGVLHFTHRLLRLGLAKGAMEIVGEKLVIRAILKEEVFVEGEIHEVKYIGGGS